MQERHINRKLYFEELVTTTSKYLIPYIKQFMDVTPDKNILEVGCGDGGILFAFAKLGCNTVGIDLCNEKISSAISCFEQEGVKSTLICADFFAIEEYKNFFDLIIIHDVIEHIPDKKSFLIHVKKFLKSEGKIFISFPGWQMPFGGHQQICPHKIISKLPFIHLLPKRIYKWILKLGKQSEGAISELFSIRECRVTIEKFRKLIRDNNLSIINEQFYLINPHYEIKFKLRLRKLNRLIGKIPYFRNFVASTCFYLLQSNKS